MQNFTMLKMFLSASVVGMLSLVTLEQLFGIKRKPKAPVSFGVFEGKAKSNSQ